MHTLFVEAFGPLVAAFLLFAVVYSARRVVYQFRNRLTPVQRQAARDSFRRRLVHPNSAQVEQGIGALLPQRLIDLYDDHSSILAEQIEIRRPAPNPENPLEPQNPAEWIEAFLPLDLESQKYALDLPGRELGKGFCFATDGESNFYWMPASATRQGDAPVFFAHTDPAMNEQVAASLEEFLSWQRIVHAQDAGGAEALA